MPERIYDPVNYQLNGTEFRDPEEFRKFLDKITDVPESQPLNPIEIDEAGITSQQVYIEIDDITDPTKKSPILCDVTLSVDLKGHRGIHMSRCEEALFELAEGNYPDLDTFAVALAERLREKQSSNLGIVKISATHLHHRNTRKTGKQTHDKVILLSEAVAEESIVRQRTGVQAYNITACPCTRTYTKLSVVPRLQELGFDTTQINAILNTVLTGTHTQRGTITVMMDKRHPEISTRELLTVLDTTTHLVNELLKRPDEHDLVVRALSRPQFTEDVVRDVAAGLYEKFGTKAPDDTRLRIESILNDSIHIHDVRTVIDTNLGNIGESLKD
ncbi:MAG: GTP cyclohydrolase, FolE2/MptA family [Patescibacteria group bacterium]